MDIKYASSFLVSTIKISLQERAQDPIDQSSENYFDLENTMEQLYECLWLYINQSSHLIDS